MPATRAASLPGRTGIHSSATSCAVVEYIGSMTIVRTPNSWRVFCVTMSSPPPDIRVSSGLFPNITWSFAWRASSKEFEVMYFPYW